MVIETAVIVAILIYTNIVIRISLNLDPKKSLKPTLVRISAQLTSLEKFNKGCLGQNISKQMIRLTSLWHMNSALEVLTSMVSSGSGKQ